MDKSAKNGAEIDQAQMVQVRNVLHAAGECYSYETNRDVARILHERDALRAENKRLRAALLDAARDVDTRQAENERLHLLMLGLIRDNERVVARVQHLVSRWFPYGADEREIALALGQDKDAGAQG